MFQLIQKCVDSYQSEHDHGVIDSAKTLYIDSSNRQIDGCCCLFFGEEEDFPLLVAKGAFTPKGKAVYAIEFETLQQLHRIGMNTRMQMTPAPLGLWHKEGALITLQSGLPGALMENIPGRLLFSQHRAPTTIGKVMEWWHHLQQSFGVRRIKLTDEMYHKEILTPLIRFQQRYLLEQDEIDFLNRRYLVEKPLLGVELPFMVQHADFCTANMSLQPRGIGVFDWEFALNHHLPLLDLFFFFSSVHFPFSVYKGESSHFNSFIDVFWGNNYFNKAMQDSIQQACASFEIPPEILPDLFLPSLIQVANMKYDGLMESHGLHEEPDVGNGISREEKRLRWKSFDMPEKNDPFAFIRKGVFENIRFVVRHGLPDFTGASHRRSHTVPVL